ncbi:MAG: transcription antitermination factor NusB [Clostridia bacterium]|nr:transcription antitermination factor NusB [Clostridia bacterium]
MARRQARETALKSLFQVDIGKVPVEAAFENVVKEFEVEEGARKFARELVFGTVDHLKPIDEIIRRVAVDWNLERMANVDRNILRLALYEIYYRSDVPNAVAVNEAVEMAKIYSTEESGKFVNGILGKVVGNPEAYSQH